MLKTSAALLAAALLPQAAGAVAFVAGNLVVSVEGRGNTAGTYTDNQAAPLSLFQYTTAGAYVNDLVLPQTASGPNVAVSGEYGSSSEGTLQLTGDGQHLVIMGYGVNAADFNANPAAYSADGNPALGQSGSLTGQGYTPVPRVVATIDANGNVDSSTAITGVFNTNNPRAVASLDGKTFFISGQGIETDNTGGVFKTTLGSHTATSVTGNDGGSGVSQDTRDVRIVGNTVYVSTDSKKGSTNRDYIGTLGTVDGTLPANGGNGPTQLTGFGASNGKGAQAITAGKGNGLSDGKTINLSPENFFFANATTLYVADSGAPKNTSGSNASVGDGGLQKWSLVGNNWVLDYTLAAGLGLVANTSAAGSTGLYGLTGQVIDGTAYLYATNFTIGDTDQTYLYGISDLLSATSNAGQSFTQLAIAPADSNFKGVSFAPTSVSGAVPEPSTWATMLVGFGALGIVARRRRQRPAAAI